MIKIHLLCDYKGFFGSKYTAKPYRSGMNKKHLKEYFKEDGFELEFLQFSEIDFRNDYTGMIFLYTSAEDDNLLYKNYIEDVVFGLELCGAIVIPSFKYLRAANNKVMMEIVRTSSLLADINNIKSFHFGCIEEVKEHIIEDKKWVFKIADGAQGRGVGAGTGKNLLVSLKKLSRSISWYSEFKDFIRRLKHPGYIPESKYRRKFILQEYIDGLKFDYKVLVYGSKVFVLKRYNRANDFRASGSGNFVFEKDVPRQILNFASKIIQDLDVPNISLDIAFNGSEVFLIEFQCVYFGSTTIEKAPFYFTFKNNIWNCIEAKSDLEKVYVNSIISYLKGRSE